MITAPRGAAAVLLAAVALAGGSAASAAAEPSADAVVSQPFAADSGDVCPMGVARGKLGWDLNGLRAVAVAGTVLDRPLPEDVGVGCGEDGRFSVATFTAFANSVSAPLDTESLAVNNGLRELRVKLEANRPIEVVVVQVCRRALFAGPSDSCGAAKRFPAPVIQMR